MINHYRSQKFKENKSIKTLQTIINLEAKRWKERQSKIIQARASQLVRNSSELPLGRTSSL